MLTATPQDVILTNRKLIDDFKVWTVDRTGFLSDDNAWSNRALLSQFNHYRAQLIDQELDRNPNSYRHARQTIPCIPLERVDKNECPCAPASGCSWRKTKFKLPKPIGKLITVDSIDGSIKYSYVDWDSVKYKFSSRIPADRSRPYYTIKNGYLYLHNDIHKRYVTVTATWADPLLIQTYPDCKGELDPCVKKLDLEFP